MFPPRPSARPAARHFGSAQKICRWGGRRAVPAEFRTPRSLIRLLARQGRLLEVLGGARAESRRSLARRRGAGRSCAIQRTLLNILRARAGNARRVAVQGLPDSGDVANLGARAAETAHPKRTFLQSAGATTLPAQPRRVRAARRQRSAYRSRS